MKLFEMLVATCTNNHDQYQKNKLHSRAMETVFNFVKEQD
jgi:hypothetical protein